MNTLRLKADAGLIGMPEFAAVLDQAAQIVRAGGLVAFPTETVYGLGANALDADAVERIFAAKGRPKWDPIIVHVASQEMARSLVSSFPEPAERLMRAFWPGPLTLLLPRSAAIHDIVTAGRPLVGLRMPAHPVALELIRCAGVPIAAPSANRFSHVSPTAAAHVLSDLDGRIDAVLEAVLDADFGAGPAQHGIESTVLDPSQSPMLIYRPGAVTQAMIREVAGPVEMFESRAELRELPSEALPSPGVGLRHYAPRARLVLLEAASREAGPAAAELAILIARAVHELAGERLGVMLPGGVPLGGEQPRAAIFNWGRWDAPGEMAQLLYAGLRALDEQECSVILCPVPPHGGIGAAIRDRLRKAGTKRQETGNRE